MDYLEYIKDLKKKRVEARRQEELRHFGLAQPFLVQFNGTAHAQSLDSPLGTVTTLDRFGLAEPQFVKIRDEVYMLDILFRMLTPVELARAMSFPEWYQFTGNRRAKVRQIGNAVPVRTAEAVCKALLS